MLPYRTPGIYPDTPSFCSEYYTWFQELGYPQLDLLRFEDGEWSIIELYNSPVIAAQTQWKHVLSGMRNVEISFGFIRKYVELLDITKEAYWDMELAKSRKVIAKTKEAERRRADLAKRAAAIISKHDHIKERVAKNGIREVLPWHIAKHIPAREIKSNFI